jgi:hypothetical protein
MASGLPQIDTLENGMMAETAEDKIFFFQLMARIQSLS